MRKPRTQHSLDRSIVERLLFRRFPDHDAFIRRRAFSWSAEIVELGQPGPPYRTRVIAEGATIEELRKDLEAL